MSQKLKVDRTTYDRLTVIDGQTGEVVGIGAEEYDFIAVPKRQRFKEGFVMVFLQGLAELAKCELSGFDCKVLFIMMSKCDYENWIVCSPTEIANKLSVSLPSVSRALRRLRERGIVECRTVSGHTKAWRLCSSFGWRGKVKNFALRRQEELTEGIAPLSDIV